MYVPPEALIEVPVDFISNPFELKSVATPLLLAVSAFDKSATNEEVKAAHRKMVKKYHPDKLQHLGEEHIKGAEEKFKEVQLAYELIQEERKM